MDFKMDALERRFGVKTGGDSGLDLGDILGPSKAAPPPSAPASSAPPMASSSSMTLAPTASTENTAAQLPELPNPSSLPVPSSTPSMLPDLGPSVSQPIRALEVDVSALPPPSTRLPPNPNDGDSGLLPKLAEREPNPSTYIGHPPSSIASLGSGAYKPGITEFKSSSTAPGDNLDTASMQAPAARPAAPFSSGVLTSRSHGISSVSLGPTPGMPGKSGISFTGGSTLRRGGAAGAGGGKAAYDEFDDFFDGPSKAGHQRPTGLAAPAASVPQQPAHYKMSDPVAVGAYGDLPTMSLPDKSTGAISAEYRSATPLEGIDGHAKLAQRLNVGRNSRPATSSTCQPNIFAALTVLTFLLAGVLYIGDIEEINFRLSGTPEPSVLEQVEAKQAQLVGMRVPDSAEALTPDSPESLEAEVASLPEPVPDTANEAANPVEDVTTDNPLSVTTAFKPAEDEEEPQVGQEEETNQMPEPVEPRVEQSLISEEGVPEIMSQFSEDVEPVMGSAAKDAKRPKALKKAKSIAKTAVIDQPKLPKKDPKTQTALKESRDSSRGKRGARALLQRLPPLVWA